MDSMADNNKKLKQEKENIQKESEQNDTNLTEEVDFSEITIEDEVIPTINTDLSINISSDDVLDLTEEEALIVAQQIELEIERYEDILIEGEDKFLTEEEIKSLGFNPEEYSRLRALEKTVYFHIRRLRKQQKGKGFFAQLPVWAAILGLLSSLFNVVPVNPYLPILIYTGLYNSFNTNFMQEVSGMYVVYTIYTAIFFIIEIVVLLLLLKRGRKDREKMPAFKSLLIIFIFNLVVVIPAIIIFINIAMNV